MCNLRLKFWDYLKNFSDFIGISSYVMQFFNDFRGAFKDLVFPLTPIVEGSLYIAVCFFCLLNISLIFINFAEDELCVCVGFRVIVSGDV